jgi:hypothetical protein
MVSIRVSLSILSLYDVRLIRWAIAARYNEHLRIVGDSQVRVCSVVDNLPHIMEAVERGAPVRIAALYHLLKNTPPHALHAVESGARKVQR